MLSACGPKNLRPNPNACVVPSVLLVARPLPVIEGKTWRAVADYAARSASHASEREADIATIRDVCRKR